MAKKRSNIILLIALIVLALIFAIVAAGAARTAYDKRVAGEKLTEIDYYSMQGFCEENANAVMDALKSGSKDKLKKLMPEAEGIDELMAFAKWKKADFKNAVSQGAGSLTEAPDEAGKMDVSEAFFVDIGDTKYVLFVETLTSRWGRQNEGVTAVAATTYDHYDGLDVRWNGEPDEESVLAGKLWWNK